jgi:hypothetical protein
VLTGSSPAIPASAWRSISTESARVWTRHPCGAESWKRKVFFVILGSNYKTIDMNIGKRIEEIVHERGISPSWLAEQIPCERTNIYNIFRRKSVGSDLLFVLSTILQHDFFAELSADWQQTTAGDKREAPEE